MIRMKYTPDILTGPVFESYVRGAAALVGKPAWLPFLFCVGRDRTMIRNHSAAPRGSLSGGWFSDRPGPARRLDGSH